jgi:hypothetical protein
MLFLIITMPLTGLLVAIFHPSSAIPAAIFSFSATVGVAVYSHEQTEKREIEARHFAEKRNVYLAFFEIIFRLFKAEKNGKKVAEKELIESLTSFQQKLLVWGSPEVIKAFEQYMRNSKPSDSKTTMSNMEALFKAFRKDLGHNDTLLAQYSLVGLMLDEEARKELI